MGSREDDRLWLFRNLAIAIMVFAAVGIEVGRCGTNFDSNKSNIKAFCSSKKYLMTSYFEKYENLVDSYFQDFIARELHSVSCEVLPENQSPVSKHSVLQRHLIGEGSHRHLSSSIRFDIDPKSLARLPINYCEVLVVERLPSGVFADPFELQHLQQHVFTDIAVSGDTNLELPSFRSNQSAVEIHMNVGTNIFHEKALEIKLQLPLHARYQPLAETGYSKVEFGSPDLFICCCIEGKPQNKSCLFISTTGHTESKTEAAVWKIPSGIKAHTEVVSVVTFISAVLSTLAIVWASIFCSDIKPRKSSKQS
ncbi:phosphatidylinositol-glycan biosynthesis class X protein isoform X2 [Mangifera indica]|uniref:phosphatidylinositol-glycan biosynthesis class X protein isoform X2 n=1 Tax=Mangifera indica TaxID=29780 RepID=UPI001CF9E5CA|nr:phosphatidylinositol-glycan biosynthesis class X protein isoform X2 [Mangifera indica]